MYPGALGQPEQYSKIHISKTKQKIRTDPAVKSRVKMPVRLPLGKGWLSD